MLRSLSMVALAATLGMTGPASAADWGEDFRQSYPDNWALEEESPLRIEMGTRYWYSMGQHDMTVANGNYSSRDTSHILEGVIRIEDTTTGWYGKGVGGYSAVIANNYSTPAGTGALNSGEIRYWSGDIGWRALGNETLSGGGFAGYQYWNDSPDMGRQNFLTSGGGGDSQPNKIEYHMLKLGVTGKADLGDIVELTAEAALVPYAQVNGSYGAFVEPAGLPAGHVLGSTGRLSGWLYGATAEVMARLRPAENWSVGLGARAWYLTGEADFTFDSRDNGAPAATTSWITKTQQYTNFRYGLLGEVSYRF